MSRMTKAERQSGGSRFLGDLEPPKSEWVSLTDEEILDIVGRAGAGYPAVVPPYTRDLFKKIEDKLREKNG